MDIRNCQLIDPSDQHVLPSTAVVTNTVMPPPVGKLARKRRRIVLSEEEYLEALGKIVERDYYPSNTVMREQLKLLDDRQNDNASRVKLTDIRKLQYDQSAAAATDGMLVDEGSVSGAYDFDIGINDFFSKYTSEDNDSFESIREKDMVEFKKKFHWVFEPSSEDKASGYLMLYHMGGKELSGAERKKMDQLLEGRPAVGDDRPNQVDTWRFKVRNNLLFPPELESHCSTSDAAVGYGTKKESQLLLTSGENSDSTVSALPAPKKGAGTSIVNSRVGEAPRAEKSILAGNTRIEGAVGYKEPFPSPLEYPHTPTTVSSEQESRDYWSTDDDYSRGGDYRTVAMTPSHYPGDNPAMDNQLMTWGTVFGSPVELDEPHLDREDSTVSSKNEASRRGEGNSASQAGDELCSRFQIQNMSKREKLSRELEKKARKNIKSSVYDKSSSSFRRNSDVSHSIRSSFGNNRTPRTVPMSPAATALAERLSKNSTSKQGGLTAALASGLRQSYSKPHVTPRSVKMIKTPTDSNRVKGKGLPARTSTPASKTDRKSDNIAEASASENLTDGLLKL